MSTIEEALVELLGPLTNSGLQTMSLSSLTELAIGFYTVEESDVVGWTGGLLLLNGRGRPVEFHCTLPVRPSRSHEILYGATLRDYLIGDAIGSLLIDKCRNRPQLLCCNQAESLQLGSQSDFPVGLVCESAEIEEGPITDDTLPNYSALEIAGSTVRIERGSVGQARELIPLLSSFPDLVEPFARIREALREAQKQVSRSRVIDAA